MVVKAELEKLGIPFNNVELGQVDLPNDLTALQKKTLHNILLSSG